MDHTLNYKYEIFPTRPQREKINTLLFQCSQQWNKAVETHIKLHKAIGRGQFEYIINKIIEVKSQKNNNQHIRRTGIEKFRQSRPGLSFEEAAPLYDLIRMFSKSLPDLTPQDVNAKDIAEKLKKYHNEQVKLFDLETKEINKKQTVDREKFDKRNDKQIKEGKKALEYKPKKYKRKNQKIVYRELQLAIKEISGEIGSIFIKKSFQYSKGLSLSEMRNNISGSKNSIRWKTATKPSPEQRTYGAKSNPKFKPARSYPSFIFPTKDTLGKLIRKRRKGQGYLCTIKTLPKGMREVKINYHRNIPEKGNIKQMAVKRDANRYFLIFSVNIPKMDWEIPYNGDGILAGIDPGADTPLTIGIRNINTNELYGLSVKYSFLDKSMDKLSRLQQMLARKEGVFRDKQELEKAINEFKQTKEFKKLSLDEQKKKLQKRLNYLQKQRVREKPSKAWLKLNYQIKQLHLHIKNQRKDVIEKTSHMLATEFEIISFGHWEPERKISYRKRLSELRMQVRMEVQGAKKELEKLENDPAKNSRKGVKKIRRGGRDRGIATLRSKIEEKSQRSGSIFIRQNEAGSTLTCSVCRKETGPRGDLSKREWNCSECGTFHIRDLNSGFEILNKSLDVLAVQARSLATNSGDTTDIRSSDQDPWSPALNSFLKKVPVQDLDGKVSLATNRNGTTDGNSTVKLWEKNEKSVKSLKNMRVIYTPGEEKTPSKPLDSINSYQKQPVHVGAID